MSLFGRIIKYLANRDPEKFKAISHPLGVSFVVTGTVFFFLTEMLYVIPKIFSTGSSMYNLTWVASIFITYNVLANQLVIYLTDTTVASLALERQIPKPEEEQSWHYCKFCAKMVPLRAWHCILCKQCVLKRDHHCFMSASCIGHNNHRYYFWFTFYMTLGTFLSLASNIALIVMQQRSLLRYSTLMILNAKILPIPMDSNYKLDGLCILSLYAFFVAAVAFLMQVCSIFSSFFPTLDHDYDLGPSKNIHMILGRCWYWTFVSPTLKSPLPHDGTRWEKTQQINMMKK